MKNLFLLLLLFILTFPTSLAQVISLPGNTTFVVASIELYLVDDYTGGKQFIGLFGDKSRIDVFWSARYNPDILEPINVTCWLNCKSNVDITQCYGLQNCSYQGKVGPASCTIFDPKYNYSAINNITCRFLNPNYPSIEFKTREGNYPQRVFYPIKYSVAVSGGIYTVGKTINLPVTFVSFSFLTGNYTSLAYVQPTSFITIDNTHNTTSNLKYSQMETVYPKITVIYASGKTQLYINTTANELPIVCSSANDCPNIITQDYHIKACIQGKCQYIFMREIGSSYLSLPEYTLEDLRLIFLLAFTLLILILGLKKIDEGI